MIFMPPRHGKSEFVSRYFSSWLLGKFPDTRVILCSYEADFASSWGRKSRDLLEEHGKTLFGIHVSSNSSAANRWDIDDHEGGMITAGVNGPITGKGADLAIIDDPVKNAQEAESPLIQKRTYEWYKSTFRTRLHKGGVIILIMTRWNQNDLAGKLLQEAQQGGEPWRVLSLPALAEFNDALGRAEGEPLCPDLFDKSSLESLKGSVGTYWWTSLYQQAPSPLEGGMLQRGWWQYYHQLPASFDEVVQSWDMNFKDEKAAKSGNPDYVVGQVWGRKGGNRYLLDQVRGKFSFVETLGAVRGLTSKWPRATTILIEDKANGPAVISTLRTEIAGIIPVEPYGSKVARVQAISPQAEAGNVFLPDPSICGWILDFVEECSAFPNGTNDDQVDSMSQALLRFGTDLDSIFFP